MYNYIRNRPDEMYAFWAFRKENKNNVKWQNSKPILVRDNYPDGTSTIKKSE